MKEEGIYTIRQIVEKTGKGEQKVRRDIKSKHLIAYKVGWQWLINESDFIRWAEEEGIVLEAN